MWVAAIAVAAARGARSQFCRTLNSTQEIECLLCPESVGDAARANTTYYVSDRCVWDGHTPSVTLPLPRGGYVMAPLQKLIGGENAILDGSIVIPADGCAVTNVTVTKHITVSGDTAYGTLIANVQSNEPAAVIVRHPVKSKTATIYINRSTFRNIRGAGDGAISVALVHAFGPATIGCADSDHTVLSIPIDATATSMVTIDKCTHIDMNEILDVLGSAYLAQTDGTSPPDWIAVVQAYNRGATTLIVAVLALLWVGRTQRADEPLGDPGRDVGGGQGE